MLEFELAVTVSAGGGPRRTLEALRESAFLRKGVRLGGGLIVQNVAGKV